MSRAIQPAQWRALASAVADGGVQVGHVSDAPAIAKLRPLTRTAFEIECTTPRTWLESAHLMRIGPDEIARHRDGLAMNGRMLRALHTVGLFDPFEVPARGSSSLQRVMDHWAPHETGSGFVWLASPAGSRAAQVRAGRAYVRVHLRATALGLQMHPLSQALQEFPEMRGPYAEVHRTLGFDPARQVVQMLARVGYAKEAAGPSPRRPLQALLRA